MTLVSPAAICNHLTKTTFRTIWRMATPRSRQTIKLSLTTSCSLTCTLVFRLNLWQTVLINSNSSRRNSNRCCLRLVPITPRCRSNHGNSLGNEPVGGVTHITAFLYQ